MWTDRRFAGSEQLYLCPPKDAFVRVPDQILKTAVFLGLDSPTGREYGGTGYVVSVEYGPGHAITSHDERGAATVRYPFMFLVTAAHVAEKLEHTDFYIRANKKDGSLAEPKQEEGNTSWWYHPTERDAVDAAAMLLPVEEVLELDIAPIPVTLFAGENIVRSSNLGIGDEVFVAGLFKNAKGISRNIPIVRIGNVAMMPEEKILFPTKTDRERLIYAHLIESRSVGGLSGSPVFIRETIRINAGYKRLDGFYLNAANSPDPIERGLQKVELAGVGPFHFFGSLIGHWDVTIGFGTPQQEAVNMGIAPMVPAHKILEVLSQPGLLDAMNRIGMKMDEQKKQDDGTPVMDHGFEWRSDTSTRTQKTPGPDGIEIPIPTTDHFIGDLKKASRKKK